MKIYSYYGGRDRGLPPPPRGCVRVVVCVWVASLEKNKKIQIRVVGGG